MYIICLACQVHHCFSCSFSCTIRVVPPNVHPPCVYSKRITFGRYLCKIMCSWALVCDVWFLEPQV